MDLKNKAKPAHNSDIGGKEDDEEAFLHAMQYTNSCMITMILNAAIELDIFGIIARAGAGPGGVHIPASDIAAQLPARNPEMAAKLERMLRLLVTHKFLTCSLQKTDYTEEDGTAVSVERVVYGLAPSSKFLLGKPEEEGSLAGLLALSTHPTSLQTWLHTKEGIIEGGDQFQKVHGMSVFECRKKNPTFHKIYNQGMVGMTTLTTRRILEIYKGFEGLTSLADVGGGTGRTLHMIISKYPSIKAINFDLPHVIQTAPPYPGIDHVGGDMFLSVPKADAIMIKGTLHCFNDELCIKVLKNCYQVLGEDGKVIIITTIIPEIPDSYMSSRYTAGLDYIMLMQGTGKERTEHDFEILSKSSGFSKFSLVCSAYNIWAVIELYK